MTLKIEIEMDNDAFTRGQAEGEVARILREYALGIVKFGFTEGMAHKLRDINGNTIGKAETIEET